MLLTTEDILGQNIWYNSKILKDRKPFLYSNYKQQGIIFIYDLLDNEGNILTFETFRNKYQIKNKFPTLCIISECHKITSVSNSHH